LGDKAAILEGFVDGHGQTLAALFGGVNGADFPPEKVLVFCTMDAKKIFLRCLCAILLSSWARPASADMYQEVGGARSNAMGGAHRGLGNSNEAVLLNPGALPLSSRYSIDVQYDYGAADRLQHGTASVVDSKTGPVTAGVVYTRDWGNPSGVDPTINRSHAAVAYRIGQVLGLGVSLGNISGSFAVPDGRQDIAAWSSTLGVAARLGGLLGLGVVWHNAYRTGDSRLQSPALGFGASTEMGMLTLAADLVVNLREDIYKTQEYHAGAELFLFDVLALRGGWKRTHAGSARTGAPQQAISMGIGLINTSMGLNLTGERALVENRSLSILGSIQLFL
jgi:hypothetical protein